MKSMIFDRWTLARRTAGVRWRRFGADRRGGTAVQALVILPVFLILIFTLFSMWRVIMVRRTLHNGVYEATRYLSLYPINSNNQLLWADVARTIIETELRNDPFLRANLDNPSQLANSRLTVDVTFPDQKIECKSAIQITAALNFPMATVDPFPGPQFTLNEVREGEILCD